MANLSERLDQIEAAFGDEGDGWIIIIQLIDSKADLHEMPRRGEDWVSYAEALEAAEPGWPKIITLSASDERRARAAQARRN